MFRVEAVGRLKRPLVSQVVSVACCFARSWWLTTLVSIEVYLTHHRHNHVQSAANQGNLFLYYEKTWKDFQDFKPLCRDQEAMTVPPDKILNPIPCFVAYRRLPRLTFMLHYLLNSHNHLDIWVICHHKQTHAFEPDCLGGCKLMMTFYCVYLIEIWSLAESQKEVPYVHCWVKPQGFIQISYEWYQEDTEYGWIRLSWVKWTFWIYIPMSIRLTLHSFAPI